MHVVPLTAKVEVVPENEPALLADPEFALLADPELNEFRCIRCSYGISMTGPLPTCPMCQSHLWEVVTRDGAH
jgi:hypothetical protein